MTGLWVFALAHFLDAVGHHTVCKCVQGSSLNNGFVSKPSELPTQAVVLGIAGCSQF